MIILEEARVAAQMGLLGRVKKIFARPEAGSTTAVDVTPAASSVADEIAKLTSVTKAGATQYPTAADIEEYCRDPESSGCDIEMCSPYANPRPLL